MTRKNDEMSSAKTMCHDMKRAIDRLDGHKWVFVELTCHFSLDNLFWHIPRCIKLYPLDYFQKDTTSERVAPLVYCIFCNEMNQREAQEMAGMPGLI
jgi:hypothetical protein